jgi:primase-polymerase (primpol)-like protein
MRIWLPFRTSPRPAGGLNKIPYDRRGYPAKYTDPSTWMSYEEAVLQSQRPGYAGIGFVLHKELHIVGCDFDHCIVDGVLDPEVDGWVAKLNTYTELSFSGEGLHSLAYMASSRGKPTGRARSKCIPTPGSSWLPAGRSPGRRTRSCPRRPQ